MGNKDRTIRIGGASGYWGDAAIAVPQLLDGNHLNYLVFDYLAEITMGILARSRAADPGLGYATGFIETAMKPNLAAIAQQKVKVISNAGGVNPQACAAALRNVISKQGLSLRVTTVTGDDLMDQSAEISKAGCRDMFTAHALPPLEKIASVNAYLGAFPIAAALKRGADIVITGRCVDSATTLAACIGEFGWNETEFDLLAAGSLAGHILECGTQASGGNFTDWRDIDGEIDDVGYPIAEISGDGLIEITKAKTTGGLVSFGTVAEQLVYEIGDPQAYYLPDVTCDFSAVQVIEAGKDRVQVKGARGRAPGTSYKTCLISQDGYRGGHLFGYYGLEAEEKANAFAKAALRRTNKSLRDRNLPELTETSIEILGSESQFGARRTRDRSREVHAKIAVKHPSPAGIGVFLQEATGLGLSTAPGLTGFAGARPKPSPVMALYSFLWPKNKVRIQISDAKRKIDFDPVYFGEDGQSPPNRPNPPPPWNENGDLVSIPLLKLAYGRSGDKGDNANIGIIARKPEFLPVIWAALDERAMHDVFGHFLKGKVAKFYLPGISAINFVLHETLGGGGAASLRNDPQAKGYAQLLLAYSINAPKSLLEPEP